MTNKLNGLTKNQAQLLLDGLTVLDPVEESQLLDITYLAVQLRRIIENA